jgi:hypothetical protein
MIFILPSCLNTSAVVSFYVSSRVGVFARTAVASATAAVDEVKKKKSANHILSIYICVFAYMENVLDNDVVVVRSTL